jgi:hypothetical protein
MRSISGDDPSGDIFSGGDLRRPFSDRAMLTLLQTPYFAPAQDRSPAA